MWRFILISVLQLKLSLLQIHKNKLFKDLQQLLFSKVSRFAAIRNSVSVDLRQAVQISISNWSLKISPASVALRSSRPMYNKHGRLECQSTCITSLSLCEPGSPPPQASDPFCCLTEPVQSLICTPGLSLRRAMGCVCVWGGLLSLC